MSTEIARKTPMQEVLTHVTSDSFIAKLQNALPEKVGVQRFVSVVVSAIKQNPEVITSAETLYNAAIRCAQDGLMPDGREAAFVMFGNRVVYMPMIGGFRKIAAENGWTMDTQCVFKNDQFTYRLGMNPTLEHVPAPLGTERGDLIGAYCVCTHLDGRKQIEVMDKPAIEKVRAVSRSKDRGPWHDWYERQAEKTVGRRAFVKLPFSDAALERAVSVVAANDAEYDLPAPQPTMSEQEANLKAISMNLPEPADEDTQVREEPGSIERPDDAQLNRLAQLANSYDGDVSTYLIGAFNAESFEELTRAQAVQAEAALRRLVESQAEDAGEGIYEETGDPFADIPSQTDGDPGPAEPEQSSFEAMLPDDVKKRGRRRS